MNVKDKRDENWDKINKRVEAKVKSIGTFDIHLLRVYQSIIPLYKSSHT